MFKSPHSTGSDIKRNKQKGKIGLAWLLPWAVVFPDGQKLAAKRQRLGLWFPGRLRDLLKVTQLVSGRTVTGSKSPNSAPLPQLLSCIRDA